MRVRQATKSDHSEMERIVSNFFQENEFTRLGIEIDLKSTNKLVELITDNHLMLVLETVEEKPTIVGGVGGMIIPFLFNDKVLMFQEFFFYIEPKYRKYSLLLFRELELACKRLEVNNIIMGFPSYNNMDRLERFYKMRGFRKLETHFIKRI